jgi:hypothetical protein
MQEYAEEVHATSKAHLIEAKSKHEGRLNHLPPIQQSV